MDTSIFIYQLESNIRYLIFTDIIFDQIEQGHKAVTSTITMTELLVHPYRKGDDRHLDEIYGWLNIYPNLDWIALNLEIADLAARIRALHNLKTPDAVQAATAVHDLATGLITNDPAFERVPSFETLVLDQLR